MFTDYFGYTSGVSDGRYEAFTFGRTRTIHLDSESVLIEPAAAAEWKAKTERPAESPQLSAAEDTDTDSGAPAKPSEKLRNRQTRDSPNQKAVLRHC